MGSLEHPNLADDLRHEATRIDGIWRGLNDAVNACNRLTDALDLPYRLEWMQPIAETRLDVARLKRLLELAADEIAKKRGAE